MGKDCYFIVISKVGVCPSLCLFSLTKRRRSSVSRAGLLGQLGWCCTTSAAEQLFYRFFFFIKENKQMFQSYKEEAELCKQGGALRTIRVVLLNSCFIGSFFLKNGQGLHGIALSRWVFA